ncbi:hypothetical protein MMYC01_210353 [Madurella mycetomatis]|uniref:Uncharacterized protein n=1 Tax=Madurella mycetomatis TaxID=100816 RepID=A0A175VRL3_9PEZI|nr:hypothetical protein MMYC01_210353 [Madurella mycetomatis]
MYKRRFRRWGLWKHSEDSQDTAQDCTGTGPDLNVELTGKLIPPAPAARVAVRKSAVSLKAPIPEPGGSYTLRNEEMMYRAIRNYYDAAFSAQRWTFSGHVRSRAASAEDFHAHQPAVNRTKDIFEAGLETWECFLAAQDLLERPDRGSKGGKGDDFAQGIRLMRVAFARLAQLLASDSEPPFLFFWLMQIFILFLESPHPTAQLWRILLLGGISPNRFYLHICADIAIEIFKRQIGPYHRWTVSLRNFSIVNLHRRGTGDPEDKTARFRHLLQQLEAHSGYDIRHIDVLCAWSSHYLYSSSTMPGSSQEMLDQGIGMLEGVLRDPKKARAMRDNLGGGFNVYSLLASMYEKQERWDEAERAIRSAMELAELQLARTGENLDLYEGNVQLEIILRGQGKMQEADDAEEARKRLVREALEKVGESEDSA